jgi:hypothetical protein
VDIGGDTMSDITYNIRVDSGDDATFSSDITHAIVGAEWQTGHARPHDAIAQTGTARLQVDSARLSPTQIASWLGRRIRIDATHDDNTHTLFTGYVRQLETPADDQHIGTWTLIAHDALVLLESVHVTAPASTHQRTGALIATLLNGIMARPDVMAGRWLLGREGYGRLNQVRFADEHLKVALDEGQTMCAYAGGDWGAGMPVRQALRQIADAERGRIYADSDGRIVFAQRHRLLQGEAQATFNDTMRHLVMVWGNTPFARVDVTCQPYRVGDDDTPLWLASEAILIPAQSERTLRLPYHDAQRQPCAMHSITAPQAGIHYHINRRANGTGADHTHHITSTFDAGFSACRWTLGNPLAHDVYLQVGAMIIGTPLSMGDPISVSAGDDARRALFGAGTLRLDLSAISDVAFAQNVATYESARLQPDNAHVTHITLDAQHLPVSLALTLWDRVRITTSDPAHSTEAHITHMTHHLTHGASRHHITWQLTPANPAQFWVMGRAHLNNDTRIGL